MDNLLSSSCRTCMKHNAEKLVDLYESVKIEENSNLQLVELLMECTTIQVQEDDGLPQTVCEECRNLLHMWFSFKQRVFRSEQEFKKLLEDIHKLNVKIELNDDYYEPFTEPETQEQNNDLKIEENIAYSQSEKTYTEENELLEHLQSHSTEYTCDFCEKKFHKEATYLKHVCKCLNLGSSLDFKPSYFKVVIKNENGDKEMKYQCSLCEKSYPKVKSVKIHIKTHEVSNSTFICNNCGKEFTKKALLKRHIKLHNGGQKQYECKKCGKSYTRSDQLKNHMITHREHKPNVCPHCNKAFTQLCSLKDHIRTHTKETPFLCSECGKGFANRSNLRQHMLRHTGVKEHKCKMCPKAFCTKGQMTSHMATHSGEHPYKCETCGSAFTKLNSLKKHATVHSGQRPYACDNCPMRFSCKDHLKRHYRIHTGEKPYKCTYCTRAFSQSNDLVKHLRSHVGQNIYTCTVCGMGFRLKTELTQHYPIHYCTDANPLPIKPEIPLTQTIEAMNTVDVKNKVTNIQTDKFMITINSLDGSNMVAINIEPDTKAHLHQSGLV